MATLPPDPPAFMPAGPPPPPPSPSPNGLVARAKRLLLTPRLEWLAIGAEPMRVAGIFRGWVVPLAAIGPVAMLIGGLLFGYGNAFISVRPSIGFAIVHAICFYLATLAGTWGLAKAIELLAPTFGGVADPVQAMKVAAFSATAGWIAGVFALLPPIAWLGILGLYSVYLLWLGLPTLMTPARDKAVAYFAAVVVTAIVIFFAVNAIAGQIAGTFVRSSVVSVAVPGIGAIDATGLDTANRRLETAAASIEQASKQGTTALVDAAALQSLIPGAIAGFGRTGIEASSGGIAGVGGSVAKGTYANGGDNFTLSVADIGAMGALASLGGALHVNTDNKTADGYEKVVTTDDGMNSEEWHGGDRHGKVSRMIGRRFVIEAEGTVGDIAILKSAVDGVDTRKLAALPHG